LVLLSRKSVAPPKRAKTDKMEAPAGQRLLPAAAQKIVKVQKISPPAFRSHSISGWPATEVGYTVL